MNFEGWYLMLGGLMLLVVFLDTYVRRLPITTTIFYLLVGVALGPFGFKLLHLDPLQQSGFLERVTELAVILSLFTAGMKLRSPLRHDRWKVPLRLAFISMTVTVGLIALAGVMLLNLPLGSAIILGAILAPTDPVLASDVQVEHPGDRDRLRFSLTAEAGLNDGASFPFMMLGLGLLGLHDLGGGLRWLGIDVLWAVGGGLGIGALLGTVTGKLVVKLQSRSEETVGRQEFIALGLIGFSYGAAVLLQTYGFLAVFAAGLALRQYEMRTSGLKDPPRNPGDGAKIPDIDEPGKASVYIAGAVLGANEQLERIFEIAIVLFVGAMLSSRYLTTDVLWLAPLIFLVIRPISVIAGTCGAGLTSMQKGLVSWFGIRGVGSIYYLMYSIERGLPTEVVDRMCGIVLTLVALSVLVHGVSVSPIMQAYEARKAKPA